jgi:hypothetical protein
MSCELRWLIGPVPVGLARAQSWSQTCVCARARLACLALARSSFVRALEER